MWISIAFVWTLALGSGLAVLFQPRAARRSALEVVRQNALFMLTRIPLAIVGASFLATLLPDETVGAWLGGASGWHGVLVASALGGFVPSGPMVSFPIAIALMKSGAGLPQTIAFLTAWSVMAFHRILIWELPLLGWRFVGARLLSSLLLPPLSGLTAVLLLRFVAGTP